MELRCLHTDVEIFYEEFGGGGVLGLVEFLEGGAIGLPLAGEIGVDWSGEDNYVLVSGVHSEIT